MLKHTARFASLALLMFAASATPLAAQQNTPLPMPDREQPTLHVISATQQDTPLPQPDPLPPIPHVTASDTPLPQPDPLPPLPR